MSSAVPSPRCGYDHRLRALVCQLGHANLLSELDIPRSTTWGWLSRGPATVVTLDVVTKSAMELQAEVVKLRQRIAGAGVE